MGLAQLSGNPLRAFIFSQAFRLEVYPEPTISVTPGSRQTPLNAIGDLVKIVWQGSAPSLSNEQLSTAADLGNTGEVLSSSQIAPATKLQDFG